MAVDPWGIAGVVSAPTLEGTELVISGPLGRGLDASAVVEKTGLDPSGVPDGPGLEMTVFEAPGAPDGATVLWPAMEVAVAEHWVQIVETVVKVTVEMVLEVVTKVELPEVTVLVTGQVVTVSQVTTVVVASPEAGVVPAGDEGAGDETLEVAPGTEEVTIGADEVPTDVETAEVPLGGIDPTGELTGKTPLGLVPVGSGVEPTSVVVVSVTGHTVVEIGIVEVTTVVESAGQLTTSGAQLVIVTSLVVYTVDVVIWTGVVINGVEAVELPAGELIGRTPLGLGITETDNELVAVTVVSVTGPTVVETGIVEVTTVVESAGQLTTSGAQLVMVISLVVYTVEVVI